MQADCRRARARLRTCSTRLYQFRAHLAQTFCPQLGPSVADKKLDQFSHDKAAVRAPDVTRCAKGMEKPNFCNSKQTVPWSRARVLIGRFSFALHRHRPRRLDEVPLCCLAISGAHFLGGAVRPKGAWVRKYNMSPLQRNSTLSLKGKLSLPF